MNSMTIRFGVFEFDAKTRELRKDGRQIRLQDQPARILETLLDRPGELVSREALRTRLWPEGTHLDYENSLATAVATLRVALNNPAKALRFIETLPKRGYRFIGEVTADDVTLLAPEPLADAPQSQPGRPWRVSAGLGLALASVVVVLVSRSTDPVALPPDTVAVLPFEWSGVPEQAYMAQGLTEAVVYELTKIKNIGVSQPLSSSGFAEMSTSARELGVAMLLKGSVTRDGDLISIVAQLLDGHTEVEIWSGVYERSAADILTLRREVAVAGADELRVVLTSAERARLLWNDKIDLEAYDLYRWGRQCRDSREPGLGRALLNESLRLEPTFAAAHAEMALAEMDSLWLVGVRRERNERIASATASALRAIQLDPELPEAFTALGTLRMLTLEWVLAEAALRRAIELGPNMVDPHQRYEMFLNRVGRSEEALRELDIAKKLDPFSMNVKVEIASAWFLPDEPDRLRAVCADISELTAGGGLFFHMCNGHMAILESRFADAVKAFEATVSVVGRHPHFLGVLGQAYALSGDRRRVSGLLGELEQLGDAGWEVLIPMAAIHVGRSDRDEALNLLEAAMVARELMIVDMNIQPQIAPLHAESRFQQLLRDLGIPVPN